jgi:predicted PurR-regulated permease PerM
MEGWDYVLAVAAALFVGALLVHWLSGRGKYEEHPHWLAVLMYFLSLVALVVGFGGQAATGDGPPPEDAGEAEECPIFQPGC